MLIIPTDDTMFQVCDMDGNIRQKFMVQDLANIGHKHVQFFKWKDKYAYRLCDTQSAIVYDPRTDECSLRAILPVEGNVLTPDVNRDYYDRYGELQQYKYIAKECARLAAIRAMGDNSFLTWWRPDGGAFSMVRGSGCKTYSFSDVVNDVCPCDDNNFLFTLTACESDNPSVLLFQVRRNDTEGEEENFSLLEVKL